MYKHQITDDADWYAAKGVMAPAADFETVQFGQSKGKKTSAAPAPAAKPSAISKIKKAKANKTRSRPAAVVHAIVDVEDATPLSPLILETRNQFACLASPDEPTPKPVEKEPAAKPKVQPAKVENAATPIARRTRMAAKAISDVVNDVVKAVSPALLKSKSAILKHGKALGGAATRATRASGLRVMSAAAVN